MFTFSEILRYLLTPIFEEYLECGYEYTQYVNDVKLYTHRFKLPLDIDYLDCQEKALFQQSVTDVLTKFFGPKGFEWQGHWDLEVHPQIINEFQTNYYRQLCYDIQIAYENPDINEYPSSSSYSGLYIQDLNQVPESLVTKFHSLIGDDEFLRLYRQPEIEEISPSELYPSQPHHPNPSQPHHPNPSQPHHQQAIPNQFEDLLSAQMTKIAISD